MKLATLILIVSGCAWIDAAGATDTKGTVGLIMNGPDGQFWVTVVTDPSHPPSAENGQNCAGSTIAGRYIVVHPESDAGQRMVATILTAKSLSTSVEIQDTGDCAYSNDEESIKYFISD